MMIRDMFADDINRKINGVIKVDQAADDVIEQELNEYVITRELKKHFITFFNYYGDAFDQPTADMGVWISGFFGSGKSHFLKMLSYLLENKEVKGIRSVERFRKKFEDDPATFMLIDRATKGQTETAPGSLRQAHMQAHQGSILYPQPYFAGGRRTEICWSMGTKTFAVFERIPQECISGSDDERQTEQLSGRYRGKGTGTL